MAVKRNHYLTLKFLFDQGFIKENDDRLSESFNSIADKYLNIWIRPTPEPEKALIKRELYGYLKLATKINQRKVINPNLANAHNTRSLLTNAAYAGDLAIINLLITLDVDVNARAGNETALFHTWTIKGNKRRISVVKMLLEAGADPKAKDRFSKSTPIMHIIQTTNTHANDEALSDLATGIKLLLEYGADPSTKNNRGETALDILKSKGERFKSLVPLLESGEEK